jgi:hypothetical protein
MEERKIRPASWGKEGGRNGGCEKRGTRDIALKRKKGWRKGGAFSKTNAHRNHV